MLLALALLTAFHTAPDPLTGSWQITGDVVGNPLNMVCTFEQKDTQLTGSCTGETGTAMPVTGEVKEDRVTFKHGGDYAGTELTITYSGTLAEKQMKGTVDVQPFGVTGEFTATPAPAKP